MRFHGVIAATFACSLTGCLDTKADMPAAAVDGGAWAAGSGSVKPPLAQASAGGTWVIQAGAGGAAPRPTRSMQPKAAGSHARQQAGAMADAGGRQQLPVVRARSTDAGMLDAGTTEPEPDDAQSSEAEPHDAGSFDSGALDASDASPSAASQPLDPEQPLVEHSGDLIITELMIDPKALSDAQGEWIELYNASDGMLELRDCQLDDGDESLHEVPPVLIEPGAYLTIAREAEPGFSADLVVPLALTNKADSVAIVCRGEEIDRVSYDVAAEFAIKPGASLALDPEHLDAHDNDTGGAWCEGRDAFATDLGSPGQANPRCQRADDADSEREHDEHEEHDEVEQPDAGAGSHDAGVHDAGEGY